MNLQAQLQRLFHEALQSIVADPTPYASMVRPAQDARHGDYQANCAMSLTKQLGEKNPRSVAERIVAALPANDLLEPPEIAGPGFINLRLQSSWLASQLQRLANDERLGVAQAASPRTFVIDYSSPNVAKPMHVGHLRSTIIGDALKRLLCFLGHRVIGDNHLGDWGAQFGMILWGWKYQRDDDAYARDPVSELARLYKATQARIKPAEVHGPNLDKVRKLETEGKPAEAATLFAKLFTDTGLSREELEVLVAEARATEEAARAETAKLHAGDAENRQLWQQFMPHCLSALQRIYDRLDIHFDVHLGESFYDSMLAEVVEDLQKKGLAVESEGALCVFVEQTPAPFIVRKRDGAFTYATTDLATIRYRQQHFSPNELLYVVDHRQGDHFKALFAVARRWGYDDLALEHVGFGTIMGRDKRPYKTREGDVVGLESLLDESVTHARQVVDANSPHLPEDERQQIAEIVGLGAVKYADLCQNRTSDYVFDWDKMLAMDGNTATYMQYAYARNRSIFRKGEIAPEALRQTPIVPLLDTPEERDLALQILRLEDALLAAAAEYKPNLITGFLWDLANAYSRFFQNCPVLKAETPELRQSRLLLCDLTARVIETGLNLLGIRTAERM